MSKTEGRNGPQKTLLSIAWAQVWNIKDCFFEEQLFNFQSHRMEKPKLRRKKIGAVYLIKQWKKKKSQCMHWTSTGRYKGSKY